MYSPIPNTFTKNSHPTTTTIFQKKKRTTSLPTVQLGGGEKKTKLRQVFILAKFIGLVKVKCMAKKMKNYSEALVKEIMEGGKNLESIQQRFILEASFSLPVMGVSFNSYPINKKELDTK